MPMTRAPASRREGSVRRFPRLRVMLFLAFVAVTLNVAHVRWEKSVSPIDAEHLTRRTRSHP